MIRLLILAVYLTSLFSCIYGCMYESGVAEGESPLKITVLDVGQGLAVLFEWNGRHALYDFGPDSVGMVDTLVAHRVDTLEWVVLSHFHRDHIGGFLELAERNVYVRRLYVGPDTAGVFFRDSVFRLARRLNIPVDTLLRGKTVRFEDGSSAGVGGPRFDVLWPASYVRTGENRASVVMLGRFGVGKMLLTGDLDSVGERMLLEMNPSLSAELLQVGHHGSAGSNSLIFLSSVSPKYAFVSVGSDNGYGHPKPSVVRKLNLVLGDSVNLFRTDSQGSLYFEIFPGMGVVVP